MKWITNILKITLIFTELNRNLITINFLFILILREALEMILSLDVPDNEDLEDEQYDKIFKEKRFLEIY